MEVNKIIIDHWSFYEYNDFEVKNDQRSEMIYEEMGL